MRGSEPVGGNAFGEWSPRLEQYALLEWLKTNQDREANLMIGCMGHVSGQEPM